MARAALQAQQTRVELMETAGAELKLQLAETSRQLEALQDKHLQSDASDRAGPHPIEMGHVQPCPAASNAVDGIQTRRLCSIASDDVRPCPTAVVNIAGDRKRMFRLHLTASDGGLCVQKS